MPLLTWERVVLLIVLLAPTVRKLVRTYANDGALGVYKAVAGVVLQAFRASVPGVARIVKGEIQKELAGIERDMLGDGDDSAMLTIPAHGATSKQVEDQMRHLRGTELTAAANEWGGIYHESDSELTRLQARVWAAYNSVCGRHLSAAIATAFALKPPPPRPALDECALSWRLPVASQVRGRAGLIRAWHRARARVRRGGPTHLRRHRVDVRRSQASQWPSPLRCLEHALRLAAASSPCSPTARRGASAASSGRRSWRGSRRTQPS